MCGCKHGPFPNSSPNQGLASHPKAPWTLGHGWPHPPPFPPCYVGDSALKHPRIPGCGSVPRPWEERSKQVNEVGREPEAGQGPRGGSLEDSAL